MTSDDNKSDTGEKKQTSGPKTQKRGRTDTLTERGEERKRGMEREQEPNICVRRKVMSYLSDYY